MKLLLSIVAIMAAFLPLSVFAADPLAITDDTTLILPKDNSQYTLLSGSHFDSFAIATDSFSFVLNGGSTLTLVSPDRKLLINSANTQTACEASRSLLTLSLPANAIQQTATVTPSGVCGNGNGGGGGVPPPSPPPPPPINGAPFPPGTLSTSTPLSLVRVLNKPQVYIKIQDGRVIHIPNEAAFRALNLDWSAIQVISQAVFDKFHIVTLERIQGDAKIYLVLNGKKLYIPSAETFIKAGYRWQDVVEVPRGLLENTPDMIAIKGSVTQRVYRLVQGKKLWVPNIAIFNALRLRWADVQSLSQREVDAFMRVLVLKAPDSPDVYYITESDLKRHVPSSAVFLSYGNRFEDIITVSQKELDAYPNNTLIHRELDPRVYKLQKGVKRLIANARVFKRLKLKWALIAPVNDVELNWYSLGKPIH